MIARGLIALLVFVAPLGAMAASPSARAKPTWTEFWHAMKVDPPPPENFLDPPPFHGKVLNLTGGRLDDDIVKLWVAADLRRGHADGWATYNLRRDIIDAGIFGPPGLNGSGDLVDGERKKGVVRIENGGQPDSVAVGVIWLSPEVRRGMLTEYVIVLARRMTGLQSTRVFNNGMRAPFGSVRPAGEIRWQLDSGHYFFDPLLGPLWYQQTGWSCTADDGSWMGAICGRVKP